MEPLLSFLSCPKEHHRKVRTTNAIERCFNNDVSCERIIYAVFSHLNASWKGHPLPKFTHNS